MLNKTRVITAICMVLVLVPFMLLGGYFFYGLATILAFVGTYELTKMHNRKNNLPKKIDILVSILSSLLVIIIMISDILMIGNGYNYILFALLIVIVVLLIMSMLYAEIKVSDVFYYIGAIFYGGVSFAVIAALRNADITATKSFHFFSLNINLSGLCLFGYVYLTTIFTDIGAYEIGCRIGKHKLIPSVSPNKSVEGAIGGSICGTIVGTVFLVLTQHFVGFNLFGIDGIFLNIVAVFFISLALTIISQIGDLIASKLKREYGIKDYGNIFPGHGGVMDRFDSVILTCAVFFIVLAMFGVVL